MTAPGKPVDYEELAEVYPKAHRAWVLQLAACDRLRDAMLAGQMDEALVASDVLAADVRTYAVTLPSGETATWSVADLAAKVVP